MNAIELSIIPSFEELDKRVKELCETEHSSIISSLQDIPNQKFFSDSGLAQAGYRFGFPSAFAVRNRASHPELINDILMTKADDYLCEKKNSKRSCKELLLRYFRDEIYGVLTSKYSVFDDCEVMDIIRNNDYIRSAEEIWACVTPEHFHARFISPNKLYIDGDTSPLSLAVFVDNSMIGESSLKIRFGLYRHACTNGMIWGLKEFAILKEQHKGEKEWTKIVEEAISKTGEYEKMLIDLVEKASVTKSAIYDMKPEDAERYIKSVLNVGQKTVNKVLEAYEQYGGETKWHLINAITDVAHNFGIETRLRLEQTAYKVA